MSELNSLRERGLLLSKAKLVQRSSNQGPRFDMLTEDSSSSTSSVRGFVKRQNLLPDECAVCKLTGMWNGQPIVLQIDHINGVSNDHRLENLRWICPNCHSQTDTFAGRRFKKAANTCSDCGVEVSQRAKLCYKCKNHLPSERKSKGPITNRPEKIQWPSDDELKILVWEYPTSTLCKQLSVSDVAIAKRCKKLGISKPPRGYWEKLYHKS